MIVTETLAGTEPDARNGSHDGFLAESFECGRAIENPWWITPTAVKTMVTRCGHWFSTRALSLYSANFHGILVEEIKQMVSAAPAAEDLIGNTAGMSSIREKYDRSPDCTYRACWGRCDDLCVFVCCKNHDTGQMVVITALYYKTSSGFCRQVRDRAGQRGAGNIGELS